MIRTTLTLLAASLLLAACGSNATATVRCKPVTLQQHGPNGKVTATVDNPVHVGCSTARRVVFQWGRQQVGEPDAHLPAGWKCGGSRGCHKGKASVGLTLVYPG